MDEDVVNLYLAGKSGPRISESMEIPTWKVYHILERMGVDRRSNAINSRKYYVNDNFFEFIDSEIKAYWFGYMLADGHVSPDVRVVSVSCRIDDSDHLIKFRDAVSSDYPVANYIADTDYGVVHYARLKFVSSKMVSDLIGHGCVPRKSLKLKEPVNIPKEMYKHVIRGYVDGDGSITTHDSRGTPKLSIVGTKRFLGWINTNTPIGGGIYADSRKEYIYSLQYVRKAAHRNLEWMYKDAKVYMERKYQRAVELLGWI